MMLLPPDESQAIRELFPVMETCTYLDLGGRAPLPTTVRSAVAEYIDDCVYGRVDKDALFKETEQVRRQFARLINAQPEEIAFTKNTSDGLNAICAAIDWQAGDNVILCPELEHPNNVYLWVNLQEQGVELRTVPQEDGFMPVDAMIAAFTPNTRLVAVSAVSFVPGFRTDLEKLGRACREKGVLLLVDGAQSVGVVHTDVEKMCIDALSVSTQKGLLSLYGMGFLYVRKPVADRMRPAYVARFGIDLGNEGALEYEFGGAKFTFQPGARRFDLGNYNFAGVRAAGTALSLIDSIGAQRIDSHVTALAHQLGNGLLELELPVCGGKPGPHTAQTITVGHYCPEAGSDASTEQIQGIYEHLMANSIKVSLRRGFMRLSMHVYNNASDISHVLNIIREYLGSQAAKA